MKKHMKKRVMSLFMTVVMVISLIPAVTIGASATTTRPDTVLLSNDHNGGITLQNGKTYFITEDTVINNGGTLGDANSKINENRNLNGLAVAASATVTLCIPAGLTLTVYGRDAVSYTAEGSEGKPYTEKYVGGAAILLPETSTLNVVGGGTLYVKGGNAGAGAAGKQGGNSTVQDNEPDKDDDGNITETMNNYGDYYYYVGAGGQGGAGGGGGGAGIGTNGGKGGYPAEVNGTYWGKGGSWWGWTKSQVSAGSYNSETGLFHGVKDGISAKNGNNGEAALPMGTLQVSTGITISGIDMTGVVGAHGANGSGGGRGTSYSETDNTHPRGAGGSAGGGGGGGGYGGALVGTGGGGGGQGGGGGSSGYICRYYYVGGGGGAGGAGATGTGGDGTPGDYRRFDPSNDDEEDNPSIRDPYFTQTWDDSSEKYRTQGIGAFAHKNDDQESNGGDGGYGGFSGGAATSAAGSSKWKTISDNDLPSWEVTFDLTACATDAAGTQKVLDSTAMAELDAAYSDNGADETITATFDAEIPTFTQKPVCEGYRFMGYYTSPQYGEGTQIIDADGNFVSSRLSGDNYFVSWASGTKWNHVFANNESTTLYAQWAKLPEVHLYENGVPINGITQLAPNAIEDNLYLYRPGGDDVNKIIEPASSFVKLSPMQELQGEGEPVTIPGAYMAADAPESVLLDGAYSLFYRTASNTFARLENLTVVSGVRYDTATVDSYYAGITYDLDYLSVTAPKDYIKLTAADGTAAENLVLNIVPAAGYAMPVAGDLSVTQNNYPTESPVPQSDSTAQSGVPLNFTLTEETGYVQMIVAKEEIGKDDLSGEITVALKEWSDDPGTGEGSQTTGQTYLDVTLHTVGGTLSAADQQLWAKDKDYTYSRSVSTVVSLPTPAAPANSGTVRFDGWYTNIGYTGKKVVSISSTDGITGLYAKWVYSDLSETGNAMRYSYQSNYADLRGVSASAGDAAGNWLGSSAAPAAGDDIRLTFANRGFEGFYKFGILPEGNQRVDYSGTALPFVTATGADIFTNLGNNIYAAQVMAIEGNYVTLNYIVENRGDSALSNPLNIGAVADVAIGTNSNAPILRTKSGGTTYLQFNESGSGTTQSGRVYLAGNGVDKVDRYWVGHFGQSNSNGGKYWANIFNNTASNTNNGYDAAFTGEGDGALAYSWTINSLDVGETRIYTVKVGVSEQENLAFTNLTLNANGGTFGAGVDIMNINGSDISIEDGAVTVADEEPYAAPTREGYKFAGWVYVDGTAVRNGAVTTDTCIYASWVVDAKPYSVTFNSVVKNATGGDVRNVSVGAKVNSRDYSAPTTVTRGEDIVVQLSAPKGYFLSRSITVTVDEQTLTPDTGYTYAPWNNQQSATLLIYGAAVSGNVVITAEATPGPAEVPTDFTVAAAGTTLTATMTPAKAYDSAGDKVTDGDYSYAYQWYLSNDGTNQGGRKLQGADSAVYVHAGSTPGNYYYYCVLFITHVNGSTATLVSDPVAVYVDKSGSTTTVTMENWTYGEEAKTPDAAVSCGGTAQFIYYTDSGCTVMTDTAPSFGGAAAKGERPTLPGAYWVKAFFGGNATYKPSVSAAAAFTVYGTVAVPGSDALVVPNIADLVYTGQLQKPSVWDTEYYTVTSNDGGIDADNDYTVRLAITDTAKHRWLAPIEGSSYTLNTSEETIGEKVYPVGTVATVTYAIAMAENSWTTPLGCGDIIYGETPAPVAVPKFGTAVTYSYSTEKNGEFTEMNSGFTVGTWYVKAVVAEDPAGNYKAIESDAVAFTVREAQWEKPAVSKTEAAYAGARLSVELPDGATEWQYSVDNINWTDGSEESRFAAGTYYVRVKAAANHAASAPVMVTIGARKDKVTVTFNSMDGSAVDSQSVVYGKAFEAPAAPVRAGYAFGGWYTDKALTAAWNFANPVTADMTLYAKWTYTVEFNANGGAGTMDDQTFIAGETKVLSANAYDRTGYVFNGWNTAIDGTGTAYADCAHVKFTNQSTVVTLYAQWVNTENLNNYDPAGGMMNVPVGWDDNGAPTSGPSRPGYDFDRWTDNGDGSKTAQWIPKTYIVTFASNGGSGTMSDQVFTYDQEAALSDNAFTRANYIFIGWCVEAEGFGTTYADEAFVKNLTDGGTITLYAQWEALEPTSPSPEATISDPVEKGDDYEFTVTPKDGYDVPSNDADGLPNIKINGTDVTDSLIGGSIVRNDDGSFKVTVPKSAVPNGINNIAVDDIEDVTPPVVSVRFSGLEESSRLLATDAVTFDTYFNSSKMVYITARDEQSRIAKVEYLAANVAVTELAGGNWIPLYNNVDGAKSVSKSVEVGNSAGKVVVYVRVTDVIGNVTYVSTNGVVFDNAVPTIVVKQGTDTVVLDGGEIKIDPAKTITVTFGDDVNLQTVKRDNETVWTNSGNATEYTITDLLPRNTFYVLTATDKAGNTATFRVKVTGTESTVVVPSVASKVYNGMWQKAYIVDTEHYTVVSNNGEIKVGSYDVVLQLKKPGEYQWVTTTAGSDVVIDHTAGTATIKFNIIKADNAFTVPLKLANTKLTYGDMPIPTAAAKFGEVNFLYRNGESGDFATLNDALDANGFLVPGAWYVVATVEDHTNYAGLTSAPLLFTVSEIQQPKPAPLTAVNETVLDKGDGKLLGVTAAMEYKAQNDNAWIEATDEQITNGVIKNLPAGIYLVRYKAIPAEHKAAGKAATLVIGTGSSLIVTFDSNGGSAVDSKSVAYGEDFTAPDDPTKTGYTFAGWYLGETLYDFDTLVTGNITLTARWQDPKSYTVTFDANGGSGIAPESQTFTYDVEQTLRANTFTAPANCSFNGWKDARGNVYGDGAKVKNLCTGEDDNISITLYAQWIEVPNLNLDGGTLPENWNGTDAPSRPGYKFGGWKDSNGTDANPDGTEEVTAQWSVETYTITYLDVTAENDWTTSYTVESSDIELPATVTKSGYTFLGWKDIAGNNVTVIPAGSTGNVVLTAQWEREYAEVALPESVPGANISGGEFNKDGDYTFTIIPNPGYGIPDGGKPDVTVGGSPVSDKNIVPINPTDPSKGYKVTIPAEEMPNGTPVLSINGFKDVSEANVTISIGSMIKNEATLEIKKEPQAYFNSTQRITVAAVNDISGIESVQYYLSDSVLTETDLKALANENWAPYASFNYQPAAELDGQTRIVYVRVTNNDNQVSYHASDKVVFDTKLPVITAKDQSGNPVSTGASVQGSVSITVYDGTLLSVTGADSTVTVQNNRATVALKPSENTYTIVASDKAGNRSYFTVKPEFVQIPLPTVLFMPYNGMQQKGVVEDSENAKYYTEVSFDGATDVGDIGMITLQIKKEYRDKGYTWTSAGTAGSIQITDKQAAYIEIDHADGIARIPFGITRADNAWTTGPALSAATVTYPGTATVNAIAKFGPVQVFWSDNNGSTWKEWTGSNGPARPGNYKAKATVTETKNYIGLAFEVMNLTINPGKLDAPVLTAVPETIFGKGDGKIVGLTTDMEFRAEESADVWGNNWTPVEATHITKLPVGKYQVRYKETDLYEDNKVTDPIAVASGRTLTVSFDGNGGEGTVTSCAGVSYNGSVRLTANSFERTGYTFAGWNTLANGTGTSYADEGTMTDITADTVLYAQWTPTNYTVTFLANGGTGTMSDQTFTHGVAQALTGNVFTKSNCTFNGWKDTDGKVYSNSATITVTADLSLTAQWVDSSKLTNLNLGGGAVNIPDGWDGKLSTLPEPERNGYEFAGWVDENGKAVTEFPEGENGVKGNVTAQWKPKNNTVTIGSGDSPNGTIDLTIPSGTELKIDSDGNGTPDQTVTMENGLTIEDPVKSGFVFIGWEQNTADDGTVTLTAKWSEDGTNGTPADGIPDDCQKKVIFKVTNGIWSSGNDADIIVYVTLLDGAGKWSANGSGEVEVPVSTPNNGYKTPGAWDPILTVSDSKATVTGSADATYEIKYPEDTVSVGNNSFVDAGDNGTADKKPTGGSANIVAGSTIMVDPAGGEWVDFADEKQTAPQSYTIEKDSSYNMADPERTGYTFVGWKTSVNGTTTIFTAQWLGDTGGDGVPDQFQKKVIYRVVGVEAWKNGGMGEIIEYVELKDANGNWSTDSSAAGKVTKAPTALLNGYTHIGWYAEGDMQKTNKFALNNFAVTGADELILVPAWKVGNPPSDTPSKPGGSSGSTTVTIPPSDSEDGNNVKVDATIRGKEATIKPLDPEQIENAINGGAGNSGGTGTSGSAGGDVVIDLSGLGKPVEGIAIPKDTLEAIAEAGEGSGSDSGHLVIKLTTAELTIDRAAINAITDQAQGDVIKFHFDDVALTRLNSQQKQAVREMSIHKGYEAYITVNGRRISDFKGGSIELLIPFELPAGHKLSGFSVWYVDEQGELEKLDSVYDGKHKWFVATHFSDYVIAYDDAVSSNYHDCPKDETCPIHGYKDMSSSAWYHDGVHYCIDFGVMGGYGNGIFAPNGSVTRQQVWMTLARISGEKPANMTEARVWAMESGVSDGTNPTNAITRQQFVTMLYRYAVGKGHDVSVGESTNILSYADAFDVAEYAISAVQWSCGSGVMGGYADGTLKPTATTTRAHMAAFLQRFCENVVW